MKSVWIVTYEGSYGSTEIEGVFSSMSAAQVYIDSQHTCFKERYSVEEWDVREAH